MKRLRIGCVAVAFLFSHVNAVALSGINTVQEAASREQPAKFICSAIGTDRENDETYPWWIADLETAAVLKSDKPRRTRGVTLVEPLSIERLEPLRMQCSVWPGAIAAAVYLPVSNNKVVSSDAKFSSMDLHKAILYIKAEYNIISESCVLDVSIIVEQLPPGREKDPFLGYPNNALRNKALELAETDIVLLMDGDFVPGPADFLHSILNDPDVYDTLLAQLQGKSVMVVESLDVDQEKWIEGRGQISFEERLKRLIQGVHTTKSGVAKMIDHNLLYNFRPHCHTETNFSRWLGEDEVYTIQYKHTNRWPSLYEPYLMGLRAELPWWDERFRGYFFNKHSYTYALYQFGFKFLVHPGLYIIHYPHMLKGDVSSHMDTPDYKVKHELYWGVLPREFMFEKEKYRPVRAATSDVCNLEGTETVQDD